MILNVATGDSFFLKIQDVTVATYSATGLDMFVHDVKDVNEIRFDNNATAITTTLAAIKADASGDMIISVSAADAINLAYSGTICCNSNILNFQKE